MHPHPLLRLCLVLGLFLSAPASAIVIDPFTFDQFSNSNDFDGDASILGGEREIFIGLVGRGQIDVSGGVATITNPSPTNDDGQARLTYDGIDGSNAIQTAAGLGLNAADFTDGGLSDRFVIEIVGLTGATDVSVSVFGIAGVSGNSFGDFAITQAGDLEIPFADLTPSQVTGAADFAAVQAVLFNFGDIDRGDEIVVDRILTAGDVAAAVPEPTAGLLFGLGTLLVLRARR